jgi:hypothetical protein
LGFIGGGYPGAYEGAVAAFEPGYDYYKAIPWGKERWKYHTFRSNERWRLRSNPEKWIGSNPGRRLGSNPPPGTPIPNTKKNATFMGRHHRTHKRPKIIKYFS